MDNPQPLILIIGGSNTGRSPMAVALLQRLLSQHELDWRVESAGVTSHDDDYPEAEACSAMFNLNLDITDHQARALTADMVQEATLLLAIDSGMFYVLRNLYPAATEKVTTLSELAGKQRNIPDPFRMHVSTWITYAKEIESLLRDGLPRLIELVNTPTPTHTSEEKQETAEPEPDTNAVQLIVSPNIQGEAPPTANILPSPSSSIAHNNPLPAAPPTHDDYTATPPIEKPSPHASDSARIRQEHVDRCMRLLTVLRDMPEVITWDNAREQLQRELHFISVLAFDSNDLILSYTHLMHALLRMIPTTPQAKHIQTLLAHTTHMQVPITQDILADLSSSLTQWA